MLIRPVDHVVNLGADILMLWWDNAVHDAFF